MNRNKYTRLVREIVLKHDPLFACGSIEDQQDEYDFELPEIYAALDKSIDFKVLRKKLRQIFANKTGLIEAGTVFRYTSLSKDLLKIKEEISFEK